MEVWLARHAEYCAGAEGRYGDDGLTERGRDQARRLALALAPIPFARCLVSPLRRARETAELLLADRAVPLELEPSLAEGSSGELDGLTVEAARARYPEDLRLGASVVARLAASGRTAPGGEPREAFQRRVERACGAIGKALESDAGALLVVSHGGLLNYALQRLLGVPLRDEVPFGFDHCGVVKLLRYAEPPGFGPFVMARFLPPALDDPEPGRFA